MINWSLGDCFSLNNVRRTRGESVGGRGEKVDFCLFSLGTKRDTHRIMTQKNGFS